MRLWPFAVAFARFVWNYAGGPYKRRYGRGPNLSFLRRFGCLAYLNLEPSTSLRKFRSRAIRGLFVGYCDHSPAYRVLTQRRDGTWTVLESRNVEFDELRRYVPLGTVPSPRSIELDISNFVAAADVSDDGSEGGSAPPDADDSEDSDSDHGQFPSNWTADNDTKLRSLLEQNVGIPDVSYLRRWFTHISPVDFRDVVSATSSLMDAVSTSPPRANDPDSDLDVWWMDAVSSPGSEPEQAAAPAALSSGVDDDSSRVSRRCVLCDTWRDVDQSVDIDTEFDCSMAVSDGNPLSCETRASADHSCPLCEDNEDFAVHTANAFTVKVSHRAALSSTHRDEAVGDRYFERAQQSGR